MNFARHTIVSLLLYALLPAALASSHREAPFISDEPSTDNTDTYAWVSTETGKADHLVIVANYAPLEEPSGGLMFYSGRNFVRYETHIDASGNGLADFTFTMEFGTQYSPHLVMTDDGTSTVS